MYTECFKKGDWDTIKTFYCDDTIIMPSNSDCVHGKDGWFVLFFISQQYIFGFQLL